MKKILLVVISFSLILLLLPKAHAYTLTNVTTNYYNQTTTSVGQADLLDISSTSIEYMYFDLGSNILQGGYTFRLVFSNIIPTSQLLPISSMQSNIFITIRLYNNTSLIKEDLSLWRSHLTFSLYENNFTTISSITFNRIEIAVTGLPEGYDEEKAHITMQGAIMASGIGMYISNTNSSYQTGWDDAMSSKVTQIWSIWDNIFNTFMGVFNIFSIKLMGDITIGHIALVPLVLGLIGFIYALGGKRGR